MITVFWAIVVLIAILVVWTRVLWQRAERLVPAAGAFCAVTGGKIHYVEQGLKDAPVLVLIHGLSGQLQHFTYAMADDLARDFRVISVDRPGCGYSSRAHDGLADLPEQGRMIWEFLDQLGVSDPVLVGHSLGGALSLSMAQARPGKVKALALISPATRPMGATPDVFKGLEVRSPLVRRLIGHILAVPMAYLTTGLLLKKVFEPEASPDDFLAKAGAVLGYRPGAFVSASADIAMMEAALTQMEVGYETGEATPGAILFGADDAILPPDLHGPSMESYGLSCEMLAGRGHMLPITAPEETVAFVRRVALAAD